MDTKAYIKGLRQLADFYEQHPTLRFPSSDSVTVYGYVTKEDAITVASVLGHCEKVFDKDAFYLIKDLGELKLRFYFNREEVCERKVIGTKLVPEYIYPAHIEDIVEWECHPLLEAK